MDSGQPKLIPLDFQSEKPDTTGADVCLEGTSEKKLTHVGFYELEVLQAPKNDEDKEDIRSTRPGEAETQDALCNNKETDSGYLEKAEDEMVQNDASPDYFHKAEEKQPLDHEDHNLNYFDQTSQKSPQQSNRHKIISCPCKECIENLQNRCEEDQAMAINDEQKNDEFLSFEDSASINSNQSTSINFNRSASENSNRNRRDSEKSNESKSDCEKSSRSRSASEKSRHTNSSEEEHPTNKFQDAQVTLPYPDSSRPPECISRLSNAGLYVPNEDLVVKSNKDEEDKISQVVSTAFFVQHPDEKPSQEKKVQLELMEKVDVEKGEAESEPLIRTFRRAANDDHPDPRICQCNRSCLKIVGSFVTSMIVFPALLYAAYAWLPFDAPLMPDIPTRLVYTLRCASFASFPIVLGVIIHGVSRLCAASYDPFKPREREVTIHRRFVKQGTFLFVLYFFNLSVLATYLSQDHLKFIPLLTCLFTLAQLIYWLSFAVSRSFRGFGYGLTFLPLLSMMISNFYFMFLVEPEKMVFLGSRNVPHN